MKTSNSSGESRNGIRRDRGIHAAMAVAILIVGLSGCGGEKTMATVSGTVSLDGNPLENGAISFYPISGGASMAPQSAGAVIDRSGRYRATILPGRFRVEITSSRPVGQQKRYADIPDSPMDDILEEVVPPIYNTASTLQHDISLDTKTLDFSLSSQPATPQ